MTSASLSKRTAEWVDALSFDDLPREVVADATHRFLDIAGLMLAARDTELVHQVLSAEALLVDGISPVGHTQRLSLRGAAMVNGVASSVLEFDDTHIETGIHATSTTASLAIPLAHWRRGSGKELLLAFVAGSELCCRLGQVVPGYMHRNGIHPTAVFGIFGAVYAGAKFLQLTSHEILNAVGICGSMAAGLMASWEDGSSAKSLHVGLSASNAAYALGLARQGISGPPGVYEGRYGLFRTHAQKPDVEFRFDALTSGLGTRWEMLEVASKVYPAGYVVQPFVEAVLHLRAAYRIDPEQIETITCSIAEYAAPLVCEPAAEKYKPRTSWHARISLQRCVAEAMVLGRLDKDAFSKASLADASIDDLSKRVVWRTDPNAADRTRSCGGIEVRLRDGIVLNHYVQAMLGTKGHRMETDHYVNKFLANTHGVLAPRVAERAVDAILNLATAEDAGAVFALLQEPK